MNIIEVGTSLVHTLQCLLLNGNAMYNIKQYEKYIHLCLTKLQHIMHVSSWTVQELWQLLHSFKMQWGTCRRIHKLMSSWSFFRFCSLAHLGHDLSWKHEMWKQALQSEEKKSKVQGNYHFMKYRNGLISAYSHWVLIFHRLIHD